MKEKLIELAVPFIAVSFSSYYFVTVVDAPWEAKIYSFALIIGILVCSISIGMKVFIPKSDKDISESSEEKEKKVENPKFPAILAVSIVFVISIYLIGYVLSAFLFILVTPILLGYRKKSILFIALVVVGSVVALFIGILKLKLPIGILFS